MNEPLIGLSGVRVWPNGKGSAAKPAHSSQRHGDWMSTASGRKFWPLDPRPEDVDIEDIAASLSKQCRYSGHCRWHYSVAQHSVYVSHRVPPGMELVGLMHDATEAYCADVPRPLKRFLANYAQIETGIWLVIAERFGLPLQIPEAVHEADNAVLKAEMLQIMVRDPDWQLPDVEPARLRVAYWTQEQARQAFIRRFAELVKGRDVVDSTCLTCAANHYCPEHNPEPTTPQTFDGVPSVVEASEEGRNS